MKKTIYLIILLFTALQSYAESPKREFRATWLTTVFNLDWPKSKVTSTGNQTQINNQKKELKNILDKLQEANMNAVFFQIRTECDALYQSDYEPWSAYLSGTRGKDPGYDPLAYAIEESHKRGIEIHAWINPFRYESVSGKHGTDDFIRKNHPEWLLDYTGDVSIIDPGNPNVRQYIASVIKDILTKYAIDGIIFDDYFYAYAGTSKTLDNYSQNLYKPKDKNLSDWRRENINATVKVVYETIQELKPGVHFGISPFGIWTTNQKVAAAEGITLPQGIVGSDMYEQIYCDPVAWLKEKTVDYISPQLYWTTTSTGQDYKKLCPWWSEIAQKYNRHFYSSMSLSKMSNPANSPAMMKRLTLKNISLSEFNGLSSIEKQAAAAPTFGAEEMGLEIDYNRQSDLLDAPGSVFYNTSGFLKTNFVEYLKNNKFTRPALVPQMSWKPQQPTASPSDIYKEGDMLHWKCNAEHRRFAVYAVPNEEVNSPSACTTSANLLGCSWDMQYDLAPYKDIFDTHTFAVSTLDPYNRESEIIYCEMETDDPDDLINPILTRVWERSSAQGNMPSYLTNDGKQRAMAFHDGILYIAKQGGAIQRINALDGASAGADLNTGITSWGGLSGLCFSQNGTLILNSGLSASSLKIYSSSPEDGTSTIYPGISASGVNLNNVRTDFVTVYGDIEGKGGFFIYPGTTAREVYVLPVSNGTASVDQIRTIGYSGTAANVLSGIVIPVDETSFFLEGKDNIPVLMTMDGKYSTFNEDASPSKLASGLAYFSFKNKKYVVSAETLQGGINLFEVTKGVENSKKVFASNTTDLGSATNKSGFTVPICIDVQDNQVMIYVLGTDNGIAAYSFKVENITDIQTVPTTQAVAYGTFTGIKIKPAVLSHVEIWSLNGLLIYKNNLADETEIPVENGVYIIRVNDKIFKVIK